MTAPALTRIYITLDPLGRGRVIEAFARIDGDEASFVDGEVSHLITGEGRYWHRARWAAQNYACSLRDTQLRFLRAEVDRLERLDFGMKR